MRLERSPVAATGAIAALFSIGVSIAWPAPAGPDRDEIRFFPSVLAFAERGPAVLSDLHFLRTYPAPQGPPGAPTLGPPGALRRPILGMDESHHVGRLHRRRRGDRRHDSRRDRARRPHAGEDARSNELGLRVALFLARLAPVLYGSLRRALPSGQHALLHQGSLPLGRNLGGPLRSDAPVDGLSTAGLPSRWHEGRESAGRSAARRWAPAHRTRSAFPSLGWPHSYWRRCSCDAGLSSRGSQLHGRGVRRLSLTAHTVLVGATDASPGWSSGSFPSFALHHRAGARTCTASWTSSPIASGMVSGA